MKKEAIIRELEKINTKLHNISVDIDAYNSLGQFDFTTGTKLCDAVDTLSMMARNIDKAVYQKDWSKYHKNEEDQMKYHKIF